MLVGQMGRIIHIPGIRINEFLIYGLTKGYILEGLIRVNYPLNIIPLYQGLCRGVPDWKIGSGTGGGLKICKP